MSRDFGRDAKLGDAGKFYVDASTNTTWVKGGIVKSGAWYPAEDGDHMGDVFITAYNDVWQWLPVRGSNRCIWIFKGNRGHPSASTN